MARQCRTWCRSALSLSLCLSLPEGLPVAVRADTSDVDSLKTARNKKKAAQNKLFLLTF
jgi:hypothetical protein